MCFPKNNEAKIEKMWTNWSIFVLKTRWKWDYLLRLGSAEKSRVLGPSKSGSIWILKIIDFSFLEIDLRLEKVSSFLSIPHRLWRQNHDSYRNMTYKLKFRKTRKTRKVCVWIEPKIIDFSSKSVKNELKLLSLERENVSEDSDRNHRKWTKNARFEDQYF